jgi:hypothetical protein
MRYILSIFLLTLAFSCSFFGEKNKVSDYIEKPDYSLKSVEYVPVLPYFGTDIKPVNLYFGYDELLYAVDSAKGIVSYDAAGKFLGRFDLPNIHFVIQNRSLDLYALGKMDTLINNVAYNLPVLYKIGQKSASPGSEIRTLNLANARILKKLVYPFCINETSKLNNKVAVENTRFNAMGFLDDNSYYLTCAGPLEGNNELFITRRSSILYFGASDVFQGGFSEIPGVEPLGLTTLVHPPQRARMETRKDYIYTSATPGLAISVRYIEVTLTPEGLVTAFKPLATPSKTDADGFLYQPGRFQNPISVLYAGTSQKYIFVADASKDSVFAYQENGYEGTIPPPQYSNRKLIRVSFGGTGSGPYQFRRPSGLAFSNRMLYVADPGNNRISRFKLTSDYE